MDFSNLFGREALLRSRRRNGGYAGIVERAIEGSIVGVSRNTTYQSGILDEA